MKNIILFASLAVANNISAATITFNDGINGSDINTFYSSRGVAFSNAEWNNLTAGYTPHPDSDGLRLVANGANLQPKSTNPIVITFDDPMASISIIANNVNANGARLELFDAPTGGNLIASDQVIGPSGSLNANFILSASGTGIRRAELFQPRTVESEGLLFDNLTFNSIPEPTSTTLLALGSIALITRRKRL